MGVHIRNILIGIDFSPGSERALEKAVELAKQLQVMLHVIHVYEPLAVITLEAAEADGDLRGRLSEQIFVRTEKCKSLCTRIIAVRVPYSLRIFEAAAVEGILAATHELKPELVVVGSHGLGTVMRMLLGSVSTELCRRSPVPVVVVPPAHQVAASERELKSAQQSKDE